MNYLNVIQYLNILKNTIIKNLGFWLYLFTLFSIMIGFLIYIFYLKAKIYLDMNIQILIEISLLKYQILPKNHIQLKN